MSFEYLRDPAAGPQRKGVLPGAPEPFFLREGEGEHAKLFGDLFTVLSPNPAPAPPGMGVRSGRL